MSSLKTPPRPAAVAAPESGTASDAPPELAPGATRVLATSTIVFAIFFATWVMFSIVGLPMRKELGISDGQFALLVAIPVLTGALLRIPVGVIADRIGGRNTMMGLLLITAIPVYLLSRVQSYEMALVIALAIGLAGTSFAAGVAWVSAWYPPERKGFALGIFGMGNIGASVTQIFAPTLITLVAVGGLMGGAIGGGWRFVPVAYAGMLVLAAIVVPFVVPKTDRKPASGRGVIDMLKPLKVMRVWRFGYYYMTVFGAFVGISLWLPKYYVDVYDLELRTAGLIAASFVWAASLMRPVGGIMADKYGARSVMLTSFASVAVISLVLSIPMGLAPFIPIVVLLGIGLGIGTAAVFTYIPQYFPEDVGAVGGLVGCLGALGGFILPLMFAQAMDITDKPQSTFYVIFALAAIGAIILRIAVNNLRRPTPADRYSTTTNPKPGK